MNHVRLVLDPDRQVSPVHRLTFGSFVEHLGRCALPRDNPYSGTVILPPVSWAMVRRSRNGDGQ